MITTNKFDGVQLNLTMEQAYYLRLLLTNVAGPVDGPRKVLDDIHIALKSYDGAFEDLDVEGVLLKGTVYVGPDL